MFIVQYADTCTLGDKPQETTYPPIVRYDPHHPAMDLQ